MEANIGYVEGLGGAGGLVLEPCRAVSSNRKKVRIDTLSRPAEGGM